MNNEIDKILINIILVTFLSLAIACVFEYRKFKGAVVQPSYSIENTCSEYSYNNCRNY